MCSKFYLYFLTFVNFEETDSNARGLLVVEDGRLLVSGIPMFILRMITN